MLGIHVEDDEADPGVRQLFGHQTAHGAPSAEDDVIGDAGESSFHASSPEELVQLGLDD